MNIQHLIYAIEVHNCGSISKAAQNLFIAQPNLSNAIKELEQEIKIIIFKRTSRGIETTKEGLEFLRHANEIITQFNALEQMYVRRDDNVAKFSITTMRSSIICARLVRYVNYLNQSGASFRIHFKEATNCDAINDVVSGQADLGILRANSTNFDYFCHLAKSKQCQLRPLPADKYTVLMSQDHPLADTADLTPEKLKPFVEVIHGDFETPWYPYSETYTSNLTDAPMEKLLFVYDRGTLMDVIRTIKGAYTWTTSTCALELSAHGLIEKHCKGYEIEGKEAIIYRRSYPMSDQFLALIDFLSRPVM